jgi:putative sterol carrier protein
MLKFPSHEWINELSNQLNASPDYERSAKDWEGDFAFVVEPDAAYPNTAYLFLSLLHGKSPSACVMQTPNEKPAAYTLSAPYTSWRRVIEGKLDPIQGMMTRKLKLSGNLAQIMRYPKAAKEIIACCAKIPTDFGDAA